MYLILCEDYAVIFLLIFNVTFYIEHTSIELTFAFHSMCSIGYLMEVWSEVFSSNTVQALERRRV